MPNKMPYIKGRWAGFCRMEAARVTSWLSAKQNRCLPLYSVHCSGPYCRLREWTISNRFMEFSAEYSPL